jgi:hypothetical protein
LINKNIYIKASIPLINNCTHRDLKIPEIKTGTAKYKRERDKLV